MMESTVYKTNLTAIGDVQELEPNAHMVYMPKSMKSHEFFTTTTINRTGKRIQRATRFVNNYYQSLVGPAGSKVMLVAGHSCLLLNKADVSADVDYEDQDVHLYNNTSVCYRWFVEKDFVIDIEINNKTNSTEEIYNDWHFLLHKASANQLAMPMSSTPEHFSNIRPRSHLKDHRQNINLEYIIAKGELGIISSDNKRCTELSMMQHLNGALYETLSAKAPIIEDKFQNVRHGRYMTIEQNRLNVILNDIIRS